MKNQYDVVPATARQVTAFYKRENQNSIEWSSVLLANLLQVTNGRSNTQQINKSLNLETTRFKNGNLKQLGITIKAYLMHVIDAHNIGIEWKNDRFQYVESVALDIESVQPFHLWQAEAEAEAAKVKAEAEAAKAEAEAEAKRLKAETPDPAKLKKAAEAAKVKAEAEAAKAAKAAEAAKTEAEAEAAKAAEAEALESAKVAAVKAEAAEAEAEAAEAALKVERDRLIAAGGGVQARNLLTQLKRALLAGITGGNVTDLLAIADAAKELQLVATGLAMDEKAKVDGDAAGQLADTKPSANSRSAGLKKVS